MEIDGRLARLCVEGPVLGGHVRGQTPAVAEAVAILNASGRLDALTAPDVARQLDAFVTKTVTPLPREGNAPERIAETEAGMLEPIGLANPGIDRFLDDVLPRLLELAVPVWVSVGGFGGEHGDLCARLDATDAAVLELNLSCPNVAEPEDEATAIVAAARASTSKPLYAKLSPALPTSRRSPWPRPAPTASRS